jgi:hypothetical protein
VQIARKFKTELDIYNEISGSEISLPTSKTVDTERGVNQYQVQFKTFSNLYLNHSIIYNEQ